MNETFKTDFAALVRDLRAFCELNTDSCEHCPLFDAKDGFCNGSWRNDSFDLEAVVAAVEAYRKRKKPCAEVIDRALDIYTFEVEAERSYTHANEPIPVKEHADFIATFLCLQLYGGTPLSSAVRVLSAKRFVLESHREGEA